MVHLLREVEVHLEGSFEDLTSLDAIVVVVDDQNHHSFVMISDWRCFCCFCCSSSSSYYSVHDCDDDWDFDHCCCYFENVFVVVPFVAVSF